MKVLGIGAAILVGLMAMLSVFSGWGTMGDMTADLSGGSISISSADVEQGDESLNDLVRDLPSGCNGNAWIRMKYPSLRHEELEIVYGIIESIREEEMQKGLDAPCVRVVAASTRAPEWQGAPANAKHWIGLA